MRSTIDAGSSCFVSDVICAGAVRVAAGSTIVDAIVDSTIGLSSQPSLCLEKQAKLKFILVAPETSITIRTR
jgi:hypothetical protein